MIRVMNTTTYKAARLSILAGNITILLVVAWTWRGILPALGVALPSIALLNGAFWFAARRRAARSSSSNETQKATPGTGREGMRKFTQTGISALGFVICVVGYAWPQRLPRSQQNMGIEATSAIVGCILVMLPYALNRKKSKK
jgi:small neutral amino acid transporter SnatA (MarC family)